MYDIKNIQFHVRQCGKGLSGALHSEPYSESLYTLHFYLHTYFFFFEISALDGSRRKRPNWRPKAPTDFVIFVDFTIPSQKTNIKSFVKHTYNLVIRSLRPLTKYSSSV